MVQGWTMKLTDIMTRALRDRRPVLLGTSSVEESENVLNIIGNLFVGGGTCLR